MIAWRLQEQAFGGLDRESLSFLDGLARHGGSPRRRLKPGTVLVRDYHRHRRVDVSAHGVDWRQRAEPRKYVRVANIPGKMMGSQPASAASACGRSRPWVSEITPMVRIMPDQTTRGAAARAPCYRIMVCAQKGIPPHAATKGGAPMTAQAAALWPSPGPALLKARSVRSWECRAYLCRPGMAYRDPTGWLTMQSAATGARL